VTSAPCGDDIVLETEEPVACLAVDVPPVLRWFDVGHQDGVEPHIRVLVCVEDTTFVPIGLPTVGSGIDAGEPIDVDGDEAVIDVAEDVPEPVFLEHAAVHEDAQARVPRSRDHRDHGLI